MSKILGVGLILIVALGGLIGFLIYFRRSRGDSFSLAEILRGEKIDKLIGKYLWPVSALVATLATGIYFNGFEHNVFFVLEMIVLCLFAGLSTYNYKTLRRRLAVAGATNDRELLLNVFTLLNIGGFAFAAAALRSAPLHVAAVTLIYIFFSMANIRQVTVLLALPASNKNRKRYIATVEGHTWLREENGLSALAFMIISIALVVIAIFDADSSQRAEKYFFEPLKAFAAGATTFHLALSVFKFAKIVQQDDITEAVLLKVRWSQNATDTLNSVSVAVCDQWRKIILGVAIVTSITATTSYVLTRSIGLPPNH
jgi:hypothetical protein